jgi:rhodanese-related sulfurtransferase/transcriptional regulator with XRE-family HTH domain
MPKTVDPAEARALVAKGDVDVVDVRDADAWARGHVPGARNVPLADVQANARGSVTKERVLFVCSSGNRSLRAAEAAERAGLKEVYSLDGGTRAWEAAGFPIEAQSARKTDGAASAPDNPPGDPSCGLPEPALDAVVAENVRRLREQRGVSLDELARLTGLSRTVLGQIELGRTSPGVSVVWRLARAFDVHFSALLGTPEHTETLVLRGAKAKRLVNPDGRFSSRALYDATERTSVEFYELVLTAHSREDAQPHQPGTRENLVVTSGRLDLEVGGERFELAKGDAIVFRADVAHSYVNPGGEDCVMYLVMTYA